MNYIVFVAVFLAFMSIITTIALKPIIEKEIAANSNSFAGSLFGSISNVVSDIPIIGQFWTLVTAVISFAYIHPYLAIVLTALIGAPLGYVILRLARGGG